MGCVKAYLRRDARRAYATLLFFYRPSGPHAYGDSNSIVANASPTRHQRNPRFMDPSVGDANQRLIEVRADSEFESKCAPVLSVFADHLLQALTALEHLFLSHQQLALDLDPEPRPASWW